LEYWQGVSGKVLFMFYYSRYTNNPKYADIGEQTLVRALEIINNNYIYHTYCGGISGFAWTCEHLARHGFVESKDIRFLGNLKPYLLSSMEYDFAKENYDFLHGGLGVGFYFMANKNNHKEISRLLECLEQTAEKMPDGCWKWKSMLDLKSQRIGYNNYRLHSMPVYHFLCDLQHQDGRIGLGFNWGNIAQNFDFLPRVSYKNCILSKARWIITKKEIEPFMKIKNDNELVEKINIWLSVRNIPKQVLLADGDNALYIDMQNPLSIRSWLPIVKKRSSFQLEEWLFNPDTAVVKGALGTFNNEFIFSFYKTNTE
jgi:hypothetical protein